MKQNRKQVKNTKHQPSGKQKAFIGAMIAGGILVIANIAVLLVSLSTTSTQLDKQFTMRVGDTYTVKADNNKSLHLKEISDGRCPADVMCDWEGQIYYKFSYNGQELTLGSVREDDKTKVLGSGITLNFVSGDTSSGAFILRKTSE